MKNTTQKIIGNILAGAFILLAVFLFFTALVGGINKQEVNDCNKWNRQAKEYPLFYNTASEKAQCDAHGIKLIAPIK